MTKQQIQRPDFGTTEQESAFTKDKGFDTFDQGVSGSPGMGAGILHRFAEWISKVDIRAVRRRVAELRTELPMASQQELIEELIRRKCQYTAKIGAATAATGTIPVLGTLFSLTLGMMIDLGAVITAQAELVLEIAEVQGISLSDAQRRETVFLVLGLGAGLEHLGAMASQRMLRKLSHRFARRWLGHILPLVGIATNAGLNALSTYLIGRQAEAYFSHGPAAMSDWKAILGGLDEGKVSGWLKEIRQINPISLGKDFGDRAKTLIGQIKPHRDKKPHPVKDKAQDLDENIYEDINLDTLSDQTSDEIRD
ncbi:MAG: hypothetical protein ACAI44_09320 [Candidatus Sericytochromatia bacterium]